MLCFFTVIKPPLAIARLRLHPLMMSICLSVWCLSVAKCKKRDFLITIGSRTWAFQRTHHGTPKIQDGGDTPSWILTPKCKNAIFSKSNLELWCLLTTLRKLNWAFQRTYYWIPTIQDGWDTPSWNRHDVIFFCHGWSDLDKISQTGQTGA